MAQSLKCFQFIRNLSKRGLCDSLTRRFAQAAADQNGSSASQAALLGHIKTKILMRGGPLSIAEYMQDCLTSPQGGFYMSRDVFGSSGDFITSPEISQLFGEMVGIWCVHTWMAMGRPPRLQLVELGPGRGTLMADLLRGTAVFREFSPSLEVHLVEVSPALRALQWASLRCSSGDTGHSLQHQQQQQQHHHHHHHHQQHQQHHHQQQERGRLQQHEHPRGQPQPQEAAGGGEVGGSGDGRAASPASRDDLQYLRKGMTPLLGQAGGSGAAGDGNGATAAGTYSTPETGVCGFNGCQVSWHHTLDAVPDGPSPALYIAHEFFDALPVHQFVRDPKRGWLEKMVDVDMGHDAHGDIADPNLDQAGPRNVDSSSNPGSPVKSTERNGGVRDPAGSGAGGDGRASGSKSGSGSGRAQRHGDGGGNEPLGSTAGSGLRLVLSPGPTPAAALLVPRRLGALPKEVAEATDAVEISAVGMATAERLAQRIARQGGAALLVDYGRDAPPYSDSLMAIRGHRGVGILDGPGTADLSAWVDFGALRLAAEGAVPQPPQPQAQPPVDAATGSGGHGVGGVSSSPGAPPSPTTPTSPVRTSGPVTQADFLRSLGIETRLSWLVSREADPAAGEALAAGCARLLGGSGVGGMGESYKVMAIHSADLTHLAGF